MEGHALKETICSPDTDMAEMVALELDVKFTRPKKQEGVSTDDHESLMQRRKATVENEQATVAATFAPRPPVVCIMGVSRSVFQSLGRSHPRVR